MSEYSGSESDDYTEQYEDGNYGEDFYGEDDQNESFDFEERSSSPLPEDNIPECIYCYRSLLHVPHICGATTGCQDKSNILLKTCDCQWHKQIKKL